MTTDAPLHPHTRLGHTDRPAGPGPAPVNPPLVRASTLLFQDVAQLKAAHGTRAAYGRLGTDTTRALERALCDAEGAAACLLAPSGLNAITTTLLSLLRPGDHLLMTDAVYTPTRVFCDGLLKQMGIETTYYNPLLGADIRAQLRPQTKVVYVESPGSLTFEVQDIPAIAAEAHRHGALVVSDSTWATPLGWEPFKLGIDVSIHAATKYIVGHSDVLMGAILCGEALAPTLYQTHRSLGISVGGDDAYLTLRGLRTLAARLALHRDNALAVAAWLSEQPEVERVLYPPLEGSPGHDLWRRDFRPQYAGGLMGVAFRDGIAPPAQEVLIDGLALFGLGYSWGGYESLVLPVAPGAARSVTAGRWNATMLRLHVGIEGVQDLLADLGRGFDAMRRFSP